MELIYVYNGVSEEPLLVAPKDIDPEEWASVWGVRNYPDCIYFFRTVW